MTYQIKQLKQYSSTRQHHICTPCVLSHSSIVSLKISDILSQISCKLHCQLWHKPCCFCNAIFHHQHLSHSVTLVINLLITKSTYKTEIICTLVQCKLNWHKDIEKQCHTKNNGIFWDVMLCHLLNMCRLFHGIMQTSGTEIKDRLTTG
jgi:hypothetical protein